MALRFASVFARVKKFLLSRDLATIETGVELALSLNDEQVWSKLLEGVHYDPEGYKPGRNQPSWGTIVPNKIFSGTGPAQPWHDQALLLVLMRGPEQPWLKEVKTLVLGRSSWNAKGVPVLDLTGLGRFENLEKLYISSRGSVGSLAPLGDCGALRELRLQARGLEHGLEGLGAAPALASMELNVEVDSLLGLRGTTSLKSLTIASSRATIDLQGLENAPLEQLTLRGQVAGLGPLSRTPGLQSLTIARTGTVDLTPLGDCPALTSLKLHSLEGITGFPELPRVEHLELKARGYYRTPRPEVGLGRLPKVTRLDVSSLTPSGDWAVALPALEQITLSTMGCRDLDFLKGSALRTLQLNNWPTLEDMSAVATMSQLKQISLPSRHKLEAIEHLPHEVDLISPYGRNGREALHGLTLNKMPIKRIGDLSLVRGLRMLMLNGCGELTSLEGIEKCRELRVIDLRGCSALTDLTPLTRCPDLRLVALRDTRWNKATAPEEIRPMVTVARDPDLRLGLTKARPKVKPKSAQKKKKAQAKKAIPVREELRPVWEQVMPLLSTSVRAPLEEALAILEKNRDKQLFDVLLKGITWQGSRLSVRGRLTRVGKEIRPWFLFRLLTLAPSACEASILRSKPVHFDLPVAAEPGSRVRWGDLAGVETLSALEELRAYRAQKLEHAESLGRCTTLRKVHLPGLQTNDLRVLRGAEALQSVTLTKHVLTSLDGVSTLPALRTLNLTSQNTLERLTGLEGAALQELRLDGLEKVKDFSPLRQMASVSHLTLGRGGPVDARHLRIDGLQKLQLDNVSGVDFGILADSGLLSLGVSGNTPVDTLGALTGLRAFKIRRPGQALGRISLPQGLHTFEIDTAGSLDLGGLPASLTHLTLRYVNNIDLQTLPALPELQNLVLYMRQPVDLEPLRALPLKRITLYANRPFDLHSLVGHKTLEGIHITSWMMRKYDIPAALKDLVKPA